MKKFLLFVILLCIGGAAVAVVMRNQGSLLGGQKDANAQEQPKHKTVKVERGTIDLRLSSTGKLISNLDVEIKSKASGQIIKLPFDISDKVTSGSLLAELDPIDEKRNVSQREAVLASARARLAQAIESYNISVLTKDTQTSSAHAELTSAQIRNRDIQSKLVRQRDLYAKKLISREELDAAETEAASAANALLQAQSALAETATLPRTIEMRKQDILLNQSSVKQAEVDLDNVLQRLRETRIYAPMDGVITSRPVQEGQIIASGISNVGGGTTLMTLSDVSRIFVSANVDESEIGKVREGQKATITADAFPGKRFGGTVVRIAPKGTTNSNVVTFEVKIEVEGEGRDLLKPEMTANVDIQADRHEDVLVLPNETIQFGKGGYYVEVADGPTKTKRVPVQTSITDGLQTEVTEGLTENQEVVVPSSVASRWAQGGPGQGGPGAGGPGGQRTAGQNFSRGMQGAIWRLSSPGGSGGGGRGGSGGSGGGSRGSSSGSSGGGRSGGGGSGR